MQANRRRALILLWIIGGFVVLMLVFWMVYKPGLARTRLNRWLGQETNGLYHIRYDKLAFDEVAGHVLIKGLQLDWDASVYRQLKRANQAPAFLLRFSIEELEIRGINIPQIILTREVVLDSLRFTNPIIDWLITSAGKTDTLQNKEPLDRRLSIKFVSIQSGTLTIRRLQDMAPLFHAELDTLEGEDFSNQIAPDSTFRVQAFRLGISRFNWMIEPGIYQASGTRFRADSREKQMTLDSFKIISELSRSAFMATRKTQIDQFSLSFTDFSWKGWESDSLFWNKWIAREARIGTLSVDLYRDRRLPHDGRNRLDQLPHQLLATLPVEVHLPLLQISNGQLSYTELSPETDSAGTLFFDQIRGTLESIHSRPLKKGGAIQPLQASIQCRVERNAALQTAWKLFTGDPEGRFELNGKLRNGELKAFNDLAVPLGKARFEDGIVEMLEFDLNGNKRKMMGTVMILYKDLQVSLLQAKKESQVLQERKLASAFTNLFLKTNNLGKEGRKNRGRIDKARDTTKSMFNLIWKGLFEGIKDVAR